MNADSPHKLRDHIRQLNQIGIALSAETDIDRLLALVLDSAMDLTNADAGTLYLLTEGTLDFTIVKNRSLNISLDASKGDFDDFKSIPLYCDDGTPNHRFVVAHAVINEVTINLPDAYDQNEFDLSGTKQFDQERNYHSKSFLTVVLKNHEDKIIGVLQLINAMEPDSGEIVAFSEEQQKLVESLGSQAAVALTNRRLIEELAHLFESFIDMIATAIDDKSPYTGEHCRRVPVITMMLANAVNRADYGPLKQFCMDEKDAYELKIAAMLHDCGKVTTPVHVMDKATKLETIHDRIETVACRFQAVKSQIAEQLQHDALERMARGEQVDLVAVNREIEANRKRLDDDLAFLQRVNIGGEWLDEPSSKRIRQIAQQRWQNESGESVEILDDEEILNLSINRGTLNDEEREIINHHIVSTIEMLESLPFPSHLKRVPEYAGGHHERMDGKGYPRGLTRDEMSVQARIMAIADIFEALSSRDRPYKKGKKLSECVGILSNMSHDRHIDSDLFEIFIREKVYRKFAEQYMDPSQIDEIDESAVLAKSTTPD